MQPTSATSAALAAGADSSSDIYDNGSISDHNFGIKKKRPRDSIASPATPGIRKKRCKDCKRSPKATVVITDPYNFREKVHKFTGVPTPPARSTSEESERRPLLFKPRAQRAEINVPLTTFPALSSALMNSTYCCNFPLADHLPKLPVTEVDHPVEIYTSNPGDQTVEICTSNPMLPLPAFSDYKASNQQSGESDSLLFEELWEELGLAEIAVT